LKRHGVASFVFSRDNFGDYGEHVLRLVVTLEYAEQHVVAPLDEFIVQETDPCESAALDRMVDSRV
jgi:hypothetical protein